MKEQPEREEIGMTERKMMEWSLGSIIINLENIVRIPVDGQWSVVRSQLSLSDHQPHHHLQSWLSISIVKLDSCEICA
jgi:hypothetical protein